MSNAPDDNHCHSNNPRSPDYNPTAEDLAFQHNQQQAEAMANEMIDKPELLLDALVNEEPPRNLEDYAFRLAATAGDGCKDILKAALVCFRFGFEEECTHYMKLNKVKKDLQHVVEIIPPRIIDGEESDEVFAGEIMIAGFVKNIPQLTTKQMRALKDLALCLSGYKFN